MIVENKTEGIIGVRSPKGISVSLMPGGNKLTKDIYADVKSEIDFLVAAKKAEVFSKDDEKDKNKKVPIESLKDIEANAAEKLVKNTVDLKTLEAWKGEESRDSVRLALQTQIDLIKNPKAGEG